jgi:hypothetical protein
MSILNRKQPNEKANELNPIGTKVASFTAHGVGRQFSELGNLVNKIVALLSSTGDTESTETKESGYSGQVRQKKLDKGKYTLEIMTEDGWKQAYVETEIANVKHEGKLFFK